MSNNSLSVLQRDAFSSENLLHLQDISLSHCGIHRLHRFTFRNLTNLVRLNLNHNSLNYVPSQAFGTIPELRLVRVVGQ